MNERNKPDQASNSRIIGVALIICIAPVILVFLLPAISMMKSSGVPAAMAVLLLIGQLLLCGLYLFRAFDL
ncbi:MAG TPA: hypothetical protein VMG59_12350 [Phycisphaerae bacterium]|nr:hypothetical protein [Phycisphaerae bacterium]